MGAYIFVTLIFTYRWILLDFLSKLMGAIRLSGVRDVQKVQIRAVPMSELLGASDRGGKRTNC